MAQGKSKKAGYLPASQGKAPHIRADLAHGGKTLPLGSRGAVNRGIQHAATDGKSRRLGGD